MKKIGSSVLAERLTLFSKYAGLLAAFIGLLGFLGWIFNIPALKSVIPGFSTMKANTAIAFILSGAVLSFTGENKESAIHIFLKQLTSSFVFLIGLLTLGQTLFNLDFGIDQLFFQDTQTAPQSFPGRMAFATALCFTLMGLSLLLLNHQRETIRIFSQYFSVIVLVISALALIGYVYDVQALYKLDAYSSMALHTAFAFTLSSLAILFVRPNEGWSKVTIAESAGGVVLRRLIPPILFVPLFLGWLILLGESAGLYETNFGIAIISVLIAGFLVLTLFINGNQLNLIDQNLKQAQEKYITVLDSLIEGAQIIGYDWRYLYVNESVAKQGHQTRENLLGRTMMEVYPGIEQTPLFETLKNCMKNRMPHLMENEFTYPNGSKDWFELSIEPVEEGVFILSNDITKRKQAEARYRNVLDTMLEGCHIIDFDWRYLYVNETGAKHGRQDSKNLLGKTMMEAYSGIENSSLFPALKNCMELRKPAWVETEFVYPDGTSGWFEFSVQPVQEGIFILTIEITARKQAEKAFQKLNLELEQRITERTVELKTTNEQLQDELSLRKQIEADLRQSETRYRALFEQSNDAVFILDFQANHITVNQHAAEMLGYSVDEIQHLSYTDLSAETKKSEQVLKRLLAGERVPVFERLFRKKNGETFPVEMNAELVRDDLGNPIHIQSIVRDITKRKQEEEIIRRQNKMLADLHEMTLDLLKQKNLKQLFQRIINLSAEFLDAEYAEVMLVEGKELVVKAVTANQKHLLGERVKRGEALLSWQAFDTHQPASLSDYSQWAHRRDVHSQYSRYAVADFPILNNEDCIGVLAFGRTKPNYDFTEEQIQSGKLLASLSALVLTNAQLRESLRDQSIRDPLTGLFNRRYMEEMLKREVSRMTRSLHPLGIVMIDIDYFKRFNDTFGHVTGDELLRDMGRFLQSYVRGEDITCRYGGEEFILIMPDAGLEAVQKRAEQICREATNVKIEGATTITLSLGVAIYPQHGKAIDEVINAADMALYRAKQNGRNRVEVATEIRN